MAKKRFYFTVFSEFENKNQCCKNIECLHVFMYFFLYIMQSSRSKAMNVLFYTGKLYLIVHKSSNNSFLFVSPNLKTRRKLQDGVQRSMTSSHSCIFLFTKSLQTCCHLLISKALSVVFNKKSFIHSLQNKKKYCIYNVLSFSFFLRQKDNNWSWQSLF